MALKQEACGPTAADEALLRLHVPCVAACPARTDVPGYLEAITRGDLDEAWRINARDNLLPGVLGRVCSRPCEPACRHGREGLGEAVAICALKRTAADGLVEPRLAALVSGATDAAPSPSGRRVAVVGAGPAGLAVAHDLGQLGHGVTLFDAAAAAGGMVTQAIPAFRLPEAVRRRDVDRLLASPGVQFRPGVELGRDLTLDQLRATFDAVVLATGCPEGSLLDLPGAGLPGVQSGLEFLRAAQRGQAPPLGRRVAVIGGGFTAIDCARLARRLGATSVTLVVRRERQDVTVRAADLAETLREGVTLEECLLPTAVRGEGRAERLLLTCSRVVIDAAGRRVAEPVPGSERELAVDTVLVAIGQRARPCAWGGLGRAPAFDRTSGAAEGVPGLYAAGDGLTGPSTVIDAIAHGRRVAGSVDAFLRGAARPRPALTLHPAADTDRAREWDAWPRTPERLLPMAERLARADAEVDLGRTAEQSLTEARRCYLCHLVYAIEVPGCVYCGRCIELCPTRCIAYGWAPGPGGRLARALGGRPRTIAIDPADCIRCGLCLRCCPTGCIGVTRLGPGQASPVA